MCTISCDSRRCGAGARLAWFGPIRLTLAVLCAFGSGAGAGGCKAGSDEPASGAYVVDPRGLETDLSGLGAGLISVEFDVYAVGRSFDELEQHPERFVMLGRVGSGALATPAVALLPITGFAAARRLRASFTPEGPGTYVFGINKVVASSLHDGILKTGDVKNPESWTDPAGVRGGIPFPVLRTVGPCRHVSHVTPLMDPAQPNGWRVEFSEPLALDAKLPKVTGDGPPGAVAASVAVTPTVLPDSPRSVFVPATTGTLKKHGPTPQPWLIPAALGLAVPFEVAHSCAPGDVVVKLRTDVVEAYRVVRPSKVINETFHAAEIAQKAAGK